MNIIINEYLARIDNVKKPLAGCSNQTCKIRAECLRADKKLVYHLKFTCVHPELKYFILGELKHDF